MILQNDLTRGPLFPKMMRFAIPYLAACFLQTFYGMADLFITGQYYGAAPVTGVSIGSQVMHMIIVMIAGLTIGSAVSIARALGAKDEKEAFRLMGSAAALFIPFSLAFTGLLFLSMPLILQLLQTPPEALEDTRAYLTICFAGVPLIVLYNTVSGFFRGMGNTKAPMTFIAISGIVNIFLDYLLIGSLHMSAAGAAWGTFASEVVSVVLSFVYLYRKLAPLSLTRRSFLPGKKMDPPHPFHRRSHFLPGRPYPGILPHYHRHCQQPRRGSSSGGRHRRKDYQFPLPGTLCHDVHCIGYGRPEPGRRSDRKEQTGPPLWHYRLCRLRPSLHPPYPLQSP